jgi:hypothetical protein
MENWTKQNKKQNGKGSKNRNVAEREREREIRPEKRQGMKEM